MSNSKINVSTILKEITQEVILKGFHAENAKIILDKIRTTFDSDLACLALLKNTDNLISPEFLTGIIKIEHFPKLRINESSACKVAIETATTQVRFKGFQTNHEWKNYNDLDIQSEVVVPMIFDDVAIGFLILASKHHNDYRIFQEELEDIANQFTIAFQQYYFLSIATEISNLSFVNLKNEEILNELSATCSRVANTPLSAVRLITEVDDCRALEIMSCYDLKIDGLEKYIFEDDDENFCWQTVHNAQNLMRDEMMNRGEESKLLDFVLHTDDIDAEDQKLFRDVINDLKLKSVASIPIISNDQVIGVLNTYSKRNSSFLRKQSYYLMILAGNAADAILRNNLIKQNKLLNLQAKTRADELLSMASKTAFFTITKSSNHEIKNTLINISNELDSISETILSRGTSRQKFMFRLFEKRIERLITRVETLLGFFKNEKREIVAINIKNIIKDIGGFFHSPESEPPLYVSYDIQDGLPPIYCDEAEFIIIIYNLLSNATKAMYDSRDGFIDITAKREHSDIIIQIKDNGVGIRKEHEKLIYQSYFSASETEHGTGLGLYHVKELLEGSLSGNIEHQSELKKGTIFTIKIPIQ